jgi:hypothetical protein
LVVVSVARWLHDHRGSGNGTGRDYPLRGLAGDPGDAIGTMVVLEP